jgi:hypothetical protein
VCIRQHCTASRGGMAVLSSSKKTIIALLCGIALCLAALSAKQSMLLHDTQTVRRPLSDSYLPNRTATKWGERVTYIPIAPSAYSAPLRHVLAIMQPVVLSDTQCVALLMRTRGQWPALHQWWRWLPFRLRGLACAGLLSTVERVRVVYVDPRAVMPLLDAMLSRRLSKSYAAFVGRATQEAGYAPTVVGLSVDCSAALLSAMNQRAEDDADRWTSVEATGKATVHTPRTLWMSRVNGSLDLSAVNVEDLLSSSTACANHLVIAATALNDAGYMHGDVGLTNAPVMREYREHASDSHYMRDRKLHLRSLVPHGTVKTTWLADCAKGRLFESLGVLIFELASQDLSVLCGLADLFDAGGVYMDHDTLLYAGPGRGAVSRCGHPVGGRRPVA